MVETYQEEAQILIEGEGSSKKVFISGIYAQSEVPNKNKRKYKKDILEREFTRYINEHVVGKSAFGELGHSDKPALDENRICHRITEAFSSGNDWYGKSLVLSTPTGNVVKGLVEDGGKIGVSTKALGTFTPTNEGYSIVNDDLILRWVDVVINPSAPSAFVNGIYEGKEWVYNNGILTECEVIQITSQLKEHKSISGIGKRVINESEAIAVFSKFIKRLEKGRNF